MITLTTVSWIGEADALCAKLEANGIRTFVPDQFTATVLPLYGNAIGGIRVMVDERDLEQARELLRDSSPSAERGMFECPKCGSDSVVYEHVSRRFAITTLILLGIPLLWRKRQCKCKNCGNTWKTTMTQEVSPCDSSPRVDTDLPTVRVCGGCGTEYKPSDYSRYATEWLCSTCKQRLPKE